MCGQNELLWQLLFYHSFFFNEQELFAHHGIPHRLVGGLGFRCILKIEATVMVTLGDSLRKRV